MADATHSLSAVPNSVPFRKGYDARRSAGGLTNAEREFRRLLEEEHIPKASQLLADVFALAQAGDMKAAELFFRVCGLIKKPTDDAAIQEQAKALLDAMMAEARGRRMHGGDDGG
jgi:hypothetical protein